MALSYGLSLADEVEPRQALEIVRELVDGRFTDDGRLVVMDGLIVAAGPVDHPISREVEREEWGFDVESRVGFALGPEPEAWSTAEDLMAVAAVGVAARLDSDAGFSFQGERKWFLRRGGRLVLYSGWRPWTEPRVLRRIPEPYVIEPRPGLGRHPDDAAHPPGV